MIREYELTVIAKSELNDSQFTGALERYEGLMQKDGGEILRRDDWGSKRLTYPIKKQFRGHYISYDFVGDTNNVAEIERLMRFDENILRYMTVRIGENVDIKERKSQLAKELTHAAAMAADSERSPEGGGRSGHGRRQEY